MFVHLFRTRAAASARRRVPSARGVAAFAVAAIAGLPAACSQAPHRLAGPDPSDPRASVRPASYRPVIGSYAGQRPVEPSPWRDQNDRIAPGPKP